MRAFAMTDANELEFWIVKRKVQNWSREEFCDKYLSFSDGVILI